MFFVFALCFGLVMRFLVAVGELCGLLCVLVVGLLVVGFWFVIFFGGFVLCLLLCAVCVCWFVVARLVCVCLLLVLDFGFVLFVLCGGTCLTV